VYVTVLMVTGHLSPHDAVPLSKAVVFLGSLSALALNLRKSFKPSAGGSERSLIDFNICRLVVPSALLGTLIGVMLNTQVPAAFLVSLLLAILIGVTCMSGRTWWKQRTLEAGDQSADLAVTPGASSSGSAYTGLPSDDATDNHGVKPVPMQSALMPGEGLAGFLLFALIVIFGVLRSHASACQLDMAANPGQVLAPATCRPPVITAFFGDAFLSHVMSGVAERVLLACLLVPLCTCLAVAFGYGTVLVKHEGYSTTQIATYCSMALFSGSFAGLVGIGGGMIFAPFFLFMGLEPATAVATSASCVIFTSSSTTFQYLLTDRISLPLGLVYGIVNLAAAYVGTTLVHALQDKYQAKRSYISGVVFLGILTSVALCVYKLYSVASPHGVHAH